MSLPVVVGWGYVVMIVKTEAAIPAGGCFWGMQDLLRRIPTVVSTRVGYTGGDAPNPTYGEHGTHAEAIEIVFDPELLSYRQILEFFFRIHDPTTLNRQGADIGTRYRSAIFYLNQTQRRTAEATISELDNSGLLPGRVVTTVEPAGSFWEAEPEHQAYSSAIPNSAHAITSVLRQCQRVIVLCREQTSCPGCLRKPGFRNGARRDSLSHARPQSLHAATNGVSGIETDTKAG